MHGKTSLVTHDGSEFYDGVGQPFTATRYHSLAVVDGTVPDDWWSRPARPAASSWACATARPDLRGAVPPESVLTEGGYRMLGNWLESAGLAGAKATSRDLNPLVKLA
jgi:Anthranilate/para-aminobenzoate synthases component II